MTIIDRLDAIEAEIKGVAGLSGVKSADQQFMRDLRARNQQHLSESQEKWLADIERRAFGDGE